jgi:hypothetical protein
LSGEGKDLKRFKTLFKDMHIKKRGCRKLIKLVKGGPRLLKTTMTTHANNYATDKIIIDQSVTDRSKKDDLYSSLSNY